MTTSQSGKNRLVRLMAMGRDPTTREVLKMLKEDPPSPEEARQAAAILVKDLAEAAEELAALEEVVVYLQRIAACPPSPTEPSPGHPSSSS